MTDAYELLTAVKNRVKAALAEFAGVSETSVEVLDFNARSEPRVVPYARIGIAEIVHSDFTVSSDSLVIGIQVVAVVRLTDDKNPQETQLDLAKALHFAVFGERYEHDLIELSSGRVARLMPATKSTFLTDIEQVLMERAPDCTSVSMLISAEIPLGGLSF